ncbi:MAG: hypothetical protein H7246_11280 [Phycisphaerae bacterium]|nr:hypothetical protein [Saprospiraceae bacterium]
MKKLVIANCILAIAVIFSFCAKPDLKEELSSVNTNDVVSNRGTCTLINSPSNAAATLTVCGTNLNFQKCNMCPPGNVNGQGVAVFPGGQINLTLTTPIEISISTDVQTALNLNAGNGGVGPIALGANGCARFRINDDCSITPL